MECQWCDSQQGKREFSLLKSLRTSCGGSKQSPTCFLGSMLNKFPVWSLQFSLPDRAKDLSTPPSYTIGSGGCFPRIKSGRSVTLITHFHLVSSLEMSWITGLLSLSLYTFMVYTGQIYIYLSTTHLLPIKEFTDW